MNNKIDANKLEALLRSLNDGLALAQEHTHPRGARAQGHKTYRHARMLFENCNIALTRPAHNEADHIGNRLEAVERSLNAAVGSVFSPNPTALRDDITGRLFHHALTAHTQAYQILSENK
jgi:hypothetical protein